MYRFRLRGLRFLLTIFHCCVRSNFPRSAHGEGVNNFLSDTKEKSSQGKSTGGGQRKRAVRTIADGPTIQTHDWQRILQRPLDFPKPCSSRPRTTRAQRQQGWPVRVCLQDFGPRHPQLRRASKPIAAFQHGPHEHGAMALHHILGSWPLIGFHRQDLTLCPYSPHLPHFFTRSPISS